MLVNVSKQALYNIMMNEIVAPISDPSVKAQRTAAANAWRFPYWDWALPQSDTGEFGVPGIFNQSTIQLTLPDGTKPPPISNPLYMFSNTVNNVKTSMGDISMKPYNIDFSSMPEFNGCIGTSRCINYQKDPEGWIMGSEQNQLVKDAMAKREWYSPAKKWRPTGSIAHNLYRLLSNGLYKSYEPFASTKWTEQHTATEYLSLEAEPEKEIVMIKTLEDIWHTFLSLRSILSSGSIIVALQLYLYKTYDKASTDELETLLPVQGNMKGEHNDYLVNVVYDRMAFNGAPFYIRILFGRKMTRATSSSVLCGSVVFTVSVQIPKSAKTARTSKQARLAYDITYANFSSMEAAPVAQLLKDWLWWDVLPTQASINAADDSAIVKVTVEHGQAHYQYSDMLGQEVLPSFDVNSYTPL
ncbi:hypothetical protein MMC26_007580 [Xylographa opegraphella]|nr:hypothetical protein [Xylographa opegraphella]